MTHPDVINSHLPYDLGLEGVAKIGVATGSTDLVTSVAKVLMHDVKANRRSLPSVLEFAESLGDLSFLGDVCYEAMLRGPRFEGYSEQQVATFSKGAWKCVEAFDEIVFSWAHSNTRFGVHECNGGYSMAMMIDNTDHVECPYDDFHELVQRRCTQDKVPAWDVIRKLEIAANLVAEDNDYYECHEAARSNAQVSLHEIRRSLPSFFGVTA